MFENLVQHELIHKMEDAPFKTSVRNRLSIHSY